jgi:hypothetical protein
MRVLKRRIVMLLKFHLHTGMECDWAVTFPNQDHFGRILGWLAVLHFWATRQRPKQPIS